MTKLLIGSTLSEIFRTYFKSLPDLFKNNWLLFLILFIGTVLGSYYFIQYYNSIIINMHITHVYSASTWLSALGSLFIYGYGFRSIVNNDNEPMGLGGIYINMPLVKMITSVILLTLGILLLASVIGYAVLWMWGLNLSAFIPNPNNPGKIAETLKDNLGLIPIFLFIVLFSFWLELRFVTLMPYNFLQNKISFIAPFMQTKGNVLRIFVILCLINTIEGFSNIILEIVIGTLNLNLTGQSLEAAFLIAVMGLIRFTIGYLGIVTLAQIYKQLTTPATKGR